MPKGKTRIREMIEEKLDEEGLVLLELSELGFPVPGANKTDKWAVERTTKGVHHYWCYTSLTVIRKTYCNDSLYALTPDRLAEELAEGKTVEEIAYMTGNNSEFIKGAMYITGLHVSTKKPKKPMPGKPRPKPKNTLIKPKTKRLTPSQQPEMIAHMICLYEVHWFTQAEVAKATEVARLTVRSRIGHLARPVELARRMAKAKRDLTKRLGGPPELCQIKMELQNQINKFNVKPRWTRDINWEVPRTTPVLKVKPASTVIPDENTPKRVNQPMPRNPVVAYNKAEAKRKGISYGTSRAVPEVKKDSEVFDLLESI